MLKGIAAKVMRDLFERHKYDCILKLSINLGYNKPNRDTLQRIIQIISSLNKPNKPFNGSKSYWVFVEKRPKNAGYCVSVYISGIDPSVSELLGKKCREVFTSSVVKPCVFTKRRLLRSNPTLKPPKNQRRRRFSNRLPRDRGLTNIK